MREFYLKTISLHVNRSLDDLASFATEKQILRHMRSMPPPGRGAVAAAAAGTKEQRRPLRPIVITRDKVQKEVFGMGYKNLPVMSVEEFYEQRVRDGWFPPPQQQQGGAFDRKSFWAGKSNFRMLNVTNEGFTNDTE